MKGRLTAAVAAVVLLGAGIALAVGGGLSDEAMVSKSYLEDTYLPALLSSARRQIAESTALGEAYDTASGKLETAGSDHLSQAQTLGGGPVGYTPLTAEQGDILTLENGAGVLFYHGEGLLNAGSLMDATDGVCVEIGDVLIPAHRYMVTADGGATVTLRRKSDLGYQGEVAVQKAGSGGYSAGGGGGQGGSAARTMPFVDVTEDQWYYSAVSFVYEKGYFTGTGSNTFSPDASMDRAMVATVLYRLSGGKSVDQSAGFSDVPAGRWYSEAIDWASAKGVVNGMGDGTYAPSRAVTREQLITMLYRYEKDYRKVSVSGGGDLTAFPDGERVSTWSREAMGWAVGTGLIQGRSNGHLDPAGTATRAEVAAILQRFSQRLS